MQEITLSVDLNGAKYSSGALAKLVGDYDFLPGLVTASAARKFDAKRYPKKAWSLMQTGENGFKVRYVSQNPPARGQAWLKRAASSAKRAFGAKKLPVVILAPAS